MEEENKKKQNMVIKFESHSVDGIVKALEEHDCLSGADLEVVKGILNSVTKEMEPGEVEIFIQGIEGQINDPASQVLVDGKIDISALNDNVHTISQKINEDRNNRIMAEQAKLQADQAIKDAITGDENEGQSHEQLVEEFVENIRETFNDFWGNFPGIESPEFDEEDLREIAEARILIDKIDILTQEYMEKENLPYEEAYAKATAYYGNDYAKAHPAVLEMARAQKATEEVNSYAKEHNVSIEEAIQVKMEEGSPQFKAYIHKAIENGNVPKEGPLAAVGGLSAILATTVMDASNNFMEWRVRRNSLELDDILKGKNGTVDFGRIEHLTRVIERHQAGIKHFEMLLAGKNPNQIDQDKKEFFENFANLYLASGKTMSEIFDELSRTSTLNGMNFNEIAKGVGECLKDNSGASYSNVHLNDLIEAEMANRYYEVARRKVEETEKSGNKNSLKDIIKIKNDGMAERKEAKVKRQLSESKIFRDHLAEERKVSEQDLAWLPEQDKTEEQSVEIVDEDIKVLTSKEAAQRRNAIVQDKKNIQKIASDEGISYDDAVKKYFEVNPQALENYSESQRAGILRNEGEISNTTKNAASIYRTVILNYNKFLRGFSEANVSRITMQIDDYSRDGQYNPKLLANLQKQLEKETAKIKKLDRSSGRLREEEEKGNAAAIIDKEIAKNRNIDIFKEYLENGKTASQIYRECSEKGESDVTFEMVLGAIQEQSQRFIKGREIIGLMQQERKIYESERGLTAYQIRLEQGEKRKDDSWVESCKKEIVKLKDVIFNEQRKVNTTKNFILMRAGIERQEGLYPTMNDGESRTDDLMENKTVQPEIEQNPVEGQSLHSSDSKVNDYSAHIKPVAPGLEIADIKTNKGLIPNIKAIAQKGKVTMQNVKDSLANILKFRKAEKAKAVAPAKQGEEQDNKVQDAQVQDAHDDAVIE